MKSPIKIGMVAVLSAVMLFATSCKEKEQKTQGAQSFPTMEVSTSDITIETTYSASIRGRLEVQLLPRVDGHITGVLVKEGQSVKKDQVLFVIDDVPFLAAFEAAKASVAMCEAQVATAKLTYESKKNLFEQEIVSEFDLLTAKNALLTAEASLMQAVAQEVSAANNLSYARVASPADGVIGKIPYRQGDYVSPAMPVGLTTVADNKAMYVYFSMTERDVLSILTRYSNVSAAIDSMPAISLEMSNGKVYPIKGRVESISGVVDEKTGSVSLRAVFENPKGHLISGGAGSVIIPSVFEGAIVIPQESTYEIQNKTYVYKVIDGKATASIIEVEPINDGTQFVVSSGLTVGEKIISSGVLSVREGMLIK